MSTWTDETWDRVEEDLSGYADNYQGAPLRRAGGPSLRERGPLHSGELPRAGEAPQSDAAYFSKQARKYRERNVWHGRRREAIHPIRRLRWLRRSDVGNVLQARVRSNIVFGRRHADDSVLSL